MTPETIVGGLCILLLLVVGAYAIHLRLKNHDGHEPDTRPIWSPTREQAEIMAHQNISYLDAADMNAADWAAARDAHYTAKGL